MKVFFVQYTLDKGETKHVKIVNAENCTEAYLAVYLELPLDDKAAITDLFEII